MYSRCYQRYVTTLLLIVYICNQTDRNVFGFLMEPIKQDLGLSDTELGFLAGPAQVLLYTALGIPMARWGDRSHRVNLMSAAIAVWSLVVMTFAAVATFWHLALAQVAIGIGEAGFTAIAMSVIGDYHPDGAKRARALSVFMMGIPISGVVSSLLAGWINQAYGWRAVFISVGPPGLVLAALIWWTMEEPPRYQSSAAAFAAGTRSSLGSVFLTLWTRQSLRHLAVATALMNTVCSCMVTWVAAFFVRVHDMATGELGTWLAFVSGIGGSAGIWLGGYLTSRYGSHDERIQVRLIAMVTALITPMLAVALWCPSKQIALLTWLPCQALMFFFYGPTFSLVQGLCASNMRATMASVFILCQVLVGGVVGIQLLGILSDSLTSVLANSALALRWSMTATSLLALWAAAHFWMSARTIRSDVADATLGEP